MLSRRFDSYLSLVFGVLSDLNVVQRHGAVLKKILGAFQLGAGENFIRNRHFVSRISAGNVVASNGHQQLALLHGVAEARVNGQDTSGGERYNGDIAGN